MSVGPAEKRKFAASANSNLSEAKSRHRQTCLTRIFLVQKRLELQPLKSTW